MSSEIQQTVELQRSVRIGRLLIVGAIAGAIVGALLTTLFPVPEGALYTMGQIAGFMLLIGGVAGLAIGGVLALTLSAIAKRNRGTAVIEHFTVVGEGIEAPDELDVAAAIADGAVNESAEDNEQADPQAEPGRN